MKRASGVLMHISSLWGDYGIGSFGKEAKEFIDFLEKGGFTYWQVLPFSIPDNVHSPYCSYSAFSGNPYFIDLPQLFEEGLISVTELLEARQSTPYTCEFDKLQQERMPLLFRAADRVKDRTPILQFLKDHPQVDNLCRFMALKEQNGGVLWTEWTVQDPDPDAVYHWAFTQYTFHKQWQDIRSYAHERNIQIIGDIPFYVAFDSADVWANPAQFDLDEDFRPRHVAGVPPDYFSEDGQLWGNPLYRWDRMKADGFAWWKARISHTLDLFDIVRIDHFRALDTYWEIPKKAKTAKAGKWRRGPGRAFIRAMQEIGGDERIIAEDLGEVFDSVRELLKFSGYPGMRILQFGFDGDPENTHLPHNYPKNCVVYTGTHDNTTLLDYIWHLSEQERKDVLDYCGYENPNWDACYDTLIRILLASQADTAIFPIQDLLHFGGDTRMNTPGTSRDNWGYRALFDQLSRISSEKFKRWNTLYGRFVEVAQKEKD